MRKLVLFMHMSLDGFVAGPNGEMDWIHVDDELFDYAGNRTNEADLALYGRVTYQMMEGYWPTAADQPNPSKHDIEHSTWYNKVKKIVLSKTLDESKLKNTKVVSGNLAKEIGKIKNDIGSEIIIFGSPSAGHALMAENLIDEFWVFVNPMVLGKGVPMFKNSNIKLKLLTCKQMNSGVVCFHYERIV
ncbi:riboflavin biosynthesis protein RibD [Cytophagales bacterium WSM2-2]|nr:riboflavin biosynthesis protein RibD [Cytophagales bacterium WSM2-2]